MATLRFVRRCAALVAALLLCLPLHLTWRAARRPSPWPQRFLALAARAVGARVRVEGAVPHGEMMLLANHVSWIDILALGGASGAAFVAHDGIARWPVIGWLAAQNNTIFVARERRGALSAQIDAVRDAIAGHQPVALFPEGTTSDGERLLPFKPSLLAVLVPPPRPVMVQPVHIDYGTATGEIAWFGDEGAGANAKRVLRRRGTIDVTLRFLPAFDPADCADRKLLATRARESIAQSMATHGPPSASGRPAV
ncbi:MAG: lysophospholipid acyltransferase family protein [Sphingobium sp.]